MLNLQCQIGMKLLRLAVFSLLFPLICCVQIDQLEIVSDVKNDDEGELVEVRFDIGKPHLLKSAVSPEEDAVENLNLYAFADGKLIAAEYYSGDIKPSMKLFFGQRYNLYAIANVGQQEAPVDEDEFLDACHCVIDGIEDLGKSIPMAWSKVDYVVANLGERVCIKLERLAAKLLFSVEKSALRGLEIDYVRLRQCSSVVWPFKSAEGSFVDDPGDVFDCDYASEADLSVLNAGGQVQFYMLENCQGMILSGNTDPWAKVPDNIAPKSEVCTYLEVGCTFKDGYFYSGTVTYRLYLGQDSVSDFNVKRNTVLNASLYLTDDALAQVSWRVEADVAVNEGYAGGWLSRGRHGIDDLYVGEKFVYTVTLADEMMTHLNGDPKNALLCVMGEDTQSKDVFRFGEFEQTDSFDGGCSFEVQALCLKPASGTLCLMDNNGKLLTVLDDFVVQKPRLRATETQPYGELMEVEPDVPLIAFQINDNYYHCDLYLVDNDGYNLNTNLGCGFDVSLFDLSVEVDMAADDVCEALDFRIDENNGEGTFATFYGRCQNDGEDDERNDNLLGYVTSGQVLDLRFVERNFGIESTLESCLDYMPMTLTLVDNGWAGYADCQLSLLVDNPSHLPVKVHCWQLNKARDTYNSIYRNEAVERYGVDYARECYDYVCGDYSSGAMPLYCSGAVIDVCDSRAYPMPELSTDLISYALSYDYMTQSALMHQVDAAFGDGSPISKLQIVNKLSDGSTKYNLIYSNNADSGGWNDRGVWLYTSGKLLVRPGIELDGMSGVMPLSLSGFSQLQGARISVSYDAQAQNLCASVNSNKLKNFKLNTEIVINASGYVQTTPNGTWGKTVDNYCTARVSKEVKNIVLNSTATAIDGNAIKEAMNAIYSQTFTDSYNMIGSSNSYAHNAHPTSLEVSLRFSLGDGCSSKMAPIVVSLPASIDFYHSQEQLDYSVSASMLTKLNRIGLVSNLNE